MNKILAVVVAAAAGCSASGPSAVSRSERLPALRAARLATSPLTSDASAPDDHEANGKAPRVRRVTPTHGATNGGPLAGGASSTAPSGAWHTLNNPAPIFANTALLLTDGTVLVQDTGASDWWKLTPDSSGSYLDGTWSQAASLPADYAPTYYASAVLPDGRVIIEGGEYNAFQLVGTTQGAIYDPVLDQWTMVAPPAGWDSIGDAASIVLADGRYLLTNCCSDDAAAAILDSKTLTWTPFGTGKADTYNEEGLTLLQNGRVLTVDTNNLADLSESEILDPATGEWTSAGDTPVKLADFNADGTGSWEIGPQAVRPDGSVFAVGATGYTAIYNGGRWVQGPRLPVIEGEGQLDAADGPAATLPDGHVLVAASPGIFKVPLHMFDFDGAHLVEVGAPPQAPEDASFNLSMLVLPTGEVLLTDQSNDVEIYTSTRSAPRWQAPLPTNACDLEVLAPGKTYELSGIQLNGLTQGAAYGDDEQAATNYPLVRLTHLATGKVTFARTHDFGSMSIAPGARSHALFDVPENQAVGPTALVVVASGVASAPVTVTVAAPKAR